MGEGHEGTTAQENMGTGAAMATHINLCVGKILWRLAHIYICTYVCILVCFKIHQTEYLRYSIFKIFTDTYKSGLFQEIFFPL